MIRIATVGSGDITTALVTAVGEAEGIRVEAAYSRDADRARAQADTFGAPLAFADFDELLASDDVDAVYIASPNAVHGAQALAAIRAGKHVLLEKPAVLAVEEWDALVAEAEAHGVVLLEAMRTEYDPGFAAVRELLPELGVLRRATLRQESRSSRYSLVLAGERVNIFDPAMGGGALLDIGVYPVHAMVSLFGVPETVQGAAVTIASGAEGAGVVLATYPGLVVDVEYSKITRSGYGSEIQGEDATLAIDHIASPRRLTVTSDAGTREIVLDQPQHSLLGEVERFVSLIASGASAAIDHERTRETLRIILGLRRA